MQDALKVLNSLDCPHGEYIILDYDKGALHFRCRGNGVDNLRDALKDDQVSFVLLALRLELEGIPDQVRLVFMHWKGPNVKRMVLVKANQYVQEALDTLSPNHGQLEVIGKTEFNEKTISEKWRPSAGSHVIE